MFEWNAAKAVRSEKKHGVSFEEAATVFSDRNSLDVEDGGHSEWEDRRIKIGWSSRGRLLFVVYLEWSLKDEEEIYRIITARKANGNETAAYARQ